MASDEKPKFRTEYEQWLAADHKVPPIPRIEAYYGTVIRSALTAFEQGAFWRDFMSNLRNYDAEYEVTSHGYQLVADWQPKMLTKPFGSFLEKTYRKNIVSNENWPNPPNDGWWLPPDWLSRMNDIIRTTLVVKFLDGVPYLVDELKRIATKLGANASAEFIAQQDGYYAAHLYYRQIVTIPKMDWDTEPREMSLEIQITTQIKDVIKRLLHSFYETARVSAASEAAEWGWNYKSDEFIAAYLGHVLHYVDGMIIDVRERARKGTDGSKF